MIPVLETDDWVAKPDYALVWIAICRRVLRHEEEVSDGYPALAAVGEEEVPQKGATTGASQ